MEFFSVFKNDLVSEMDGYFKKKDIKIYDEFAAEKRNYPLKEKMVCVGYDDIKNSYNSFGYLGETKEGEIFGTSAVINVRLDIYTPVFSGANIPYTVFSSLADFFILNNKKFSGSSLISEEVKFDSLLEAFHLKASVKIRTFVKYYQDAAGVINKIILS